MKGWKSTAYGMRIDHYFLEGKNEPLCGTDAVFRTANPREKRRGWWCNRCEERRQKIDKRNYRRQWVKGYPRETNGATGCVDGQKEIAINIIVIVICTTLLIIFNSWGWIK